VATHERHLEKNLTQFLSHVQKRGAHPEFPDAWKQSLQETVNAAHIVNIDAPYLHHEITGEMLALEGALTPLRAVVAQINRQGKASNSLLGSLLGHFFNDVRAFAHRLKTTVPRRAMSGMGASAKDLGRAMRPLHCKLVKHSTAESVERAANELEKASETGNKFFAFLERVLRHASADAGAFPMKNCAGNPECLKHSQCRRGKEGVQGLRAEQGKGRTTHTLARRKGNHRLLQSQVSKSPQAQRAAQAQGKTAGKAHLRRVEAGTSAGKVKPSTSSAPKLMVHSK
jgi:hypothetical protein